MPSEEAPRARSPPEAGVLPMDCVFTPMSFLYFFGLLFPFREKSVHEPGVDLNSSLTTIDWLASVTPKVSGTLYFFRIFFLLLSFSLFTLLFSFFPGFIDSARFRESPRATRNLIIRTRR